MAEFNLSAETSRLFREREEFAEAYKRDLAQLQQELRSGRSQTDAALARLRQRQAARGIDPAGTAKLLSQFADVSPAAALGAGVFTALSDRAQARDQAIEDARQSLSEERELRAQKRAEEALIAQGKEAIFEAREGILSDRIGAVETLEERAFRRGESALDRASRERAASARSGKRTEELVAALKLAEGLSARQEGAEDVQQEIGRIENPELFAGLESAEAGVLALSAASIGDVQRDVGAGAPERVSSVVSGYEATIAPALNKVEENLSEAQRSGVVPPQELLRLAAVAQQKSNELAPHLTPSQQRIEGLRNRRLNDIIESLNRDIQLEALRKRAQPATELEQESMKLRAQLGLPLQP